MNWNCGPHSYFQDEETCVKDPNYHNDTSPCSPIVIIGGTMLSSGTYDACYNDDTDGSITDINCLLS